MIADLRPVLGGFKDRARTRDFRDYTKAVLELACAPGGGGGVFARARRKEKNMLRIYGECLRGGRRQQSYQIALGEAVETLANLEAAEAIGYIAGIDSELRRCLDHIIGTLSSLVR